MTASPRSLALRVLVAVLAFVAGGRAAADPIESRSGPAILPLTGLALDLPALGADGAWHLSGVWHLTDGGASFVGSDILDEVAGGRVVAGTHVKVGRFAGDCAAIAGAMVVPDRWTAARDLWGRSWAVAGGTADLGAALGKVPVIMLCAARADRGTLLLTRFFVVEGGPRTRAARLDALAGDALLERLARAWAEDRTGVVARPLARPEVEREGALAAARTVHLAHADIDVALPDDGFAWVTVASDGPRADLLERVAPAAPRLRLEVIGAPGERCADLLPTRGPGAQPRVAEPAPSHVPAGWRSYGAIPADLGLGRVICRDSMGRALVVAAYTTPGDAPGARDLGPLAPLLAALATAWDARPLPP